MLSKSTKSLLRSIGLALIFMATAGLMSRPGAPAFQQDGAEDCGNCHKIIGEHWDSSAHGQAASNEAFFQDWEQKGKDPTCLTCHAPQNSASANFLELSGVECSTCHSPFEEGHPDEVMPTNASSRLCGTCHLDTYSEWHDSVHGKENLSCNQCHNAHTTGLKSGDSQKLCLSCHQDDMHSYDLTVHAQNDIVCADCHLRISDSPLGEGHGSRIHTFSVTIDTCSKCHLTDLHTPNDPNESTVRSLLFEEGGALNVPQAGLQSEPQSVSPVGFTILGTLFGVGAGMVMAPWLEKWFQRFRN